MNNVSRTDITFKLNILVINPVIPLQLLSKCTKKKF